MVHWDREHPTGLRVKTAEKKQNNRRIRAECLACLSKQLLCVDTNNRFLAATHNINTSCAGGERTGNQETP